MASVSGSSNGYTLTLNVTQGSQSIATNTTTISWSLVFSCGSYYYQNSNTTDAFSVWIDGDTVYSANKAIWFSGSRTSVTIASGTKTITHNANGTRSVGFSCAYSPGKSASYYPGSISASGGSITLTTIPRASSFGTISGSTLGSSMTINISRNSSGFTHHLWYSMGSVTWTQIGTGIGTSVSFTPPLSLCSQIPNATSGTLKFMLRTYNGSNLVGSDVFKDITVSVPSSVVPTVSSVSVSEATSGLAAQFGGYVQGYSRLSTSVSASGSYGSTIKTYSTTIEGVNYTSQTFTSGVLRSSGSITISSKVTDSRGRTSAAKSTTVSVIAYSTPKINNFTVRRCLADGTLDDNGTCVKATFNCSISPVNNKNNKLVTLQYLNGSTWTNLNQWTTAYSYDTSYTTSAVFSADSSHDIRLIVADYFTSTSSQTSVQTAFTLMNFNASGRALAIGKVSEKSETFEIDLPSEFNDMMFIKGNQLAAECYSNGTAGYSLMVNIKILSTYADGALTFVFTNRDNILPMVVHVKFASDNSTNDPALNSICFEGNNYGAYIAKAGTSSWNLYVRNVAWDYVTLQNWWCTSQTRTRCEVTFPCTVTTTLPTGYATAAYALRDDTSNQILQKAYPVGTYWIGHTHTSPASLIGGTWYRVQSRFLWGTTTSGTIGATAGEQTHVLTQSEMPSHTHQFRRPKWFSGDATSGTSGSIYGTTSTTTYFGTGETTATGSGAAHNNMPPYVNVAIWRRTA